MAENMKAAVTFVEQGRILKTSSPYICYNDYMLCKQSAFFDSKK